MFPLALEGVLQTYQTTTNGPSATASSSGSTAEQTKEKAKEQAQQAAGQARGALRGQVDQRSTEAGERVNTIASDVRSVGEQLREQGKDQPAKLAEQAADRAERLGSYLRDSDADRILDDVEGFGRRQPWVMIAGGIAIGVLASRFLKASSSRRYEARFEPGYESSRRLPARTSDVSPQSGLGTTGGLGATGDLGRTGAGIGAADELGSTRMRTSEVGGSGVTGDLGARGFDEPAPARGAENVSPTGGVLPPHEPGAIDPRRDDEGIR